MIQTTLTLIGLVSVPAFLPATPPSPDFAWVMIKHQTKNYQKGKYENLRSRPLVVVVKPWLLIAIITSAAETCRVTCVQFIVSISNRFLAGPHSWAIWRSIDNLCGHQHVELHYNCGCAQGPNVHGPPPGSYREKRVWICLSNYGFAGPRMNFRIQIWICCFKYESANPNIHCSPDLLPPSRPPNLAHPSEKIPWNLCISFNMRSLG